MSENPGKNPLRVGREYLDLVPIGNVGAEYLADLVGKGEEMVV